MRSWAVPATLLACLAWLPARAETPAAAAPQAVPCDRVPGLAQAFTAVSTLRAAYTDRKEIALLDAPLVSTGHLYYRRPDRLHLATETPSRQSVTLAGSRVTVTQPDLGRTESLDLSASAVAKAIVTSLLRVLGGRLADLSADYACTARADADAWRLDLTPRGGPLAAVVRRLAVVVGRDGTLREVRVDDADGDTSTMTFSGLVVNRPFTADEEKAYFAP